MRGADVRRSWHDAVETVLPFALAAAALAAWAASFEAAVDAAVGAGLLWQATLVLRRRDEAAVRVRAAAGTLLAGVLAAALPRGAAAYALAPLGIACAFVGLGVLHAAAVRDRAARALRRRPAECATPERPWARDLAALALVLPTVLCALLLFPIARWRWTSAAPADAGDPRERLAPIDLGANAVQPSSHGPRRTPGKLGSNDGVGSFVFGAADAALADRVILEATPTSDGRPTGDLGQIYLRGMPLVDVDGAWVEDTTHVRSVSDVDDGRVDGWCELALRPAPSDELKLAIHQPVLEYAASGEAVMLCPPGTTSVEWSDVRSAPGGGVLTRLMQRPAAFDYRVLARLPSRLPRPRAGTSFAPGDPLAGTTPAVRKEWGDLVGLARYAEARSTSDHDLVLKVMQQLREEFQYERLDPRMNDAQALAEFVVRRRGSCLQFAEAGVVMLRALGAPARVGRGFLVGEWDADRGLYVARARDGHAWIEVAFQGCGWVIFDPTPEAADEAGSRRPAADAPPGAPESSAVGPEQEDGPSPIEQALLDFAVAFDHAKGFIEEHPWPFEAAALVAALLLARALRNRRRRLAGEPVDVKPRRGPWDHLVGDLVRRGFRRRPSQTAMEFAGAVVTTGGDAYRPLLALTARRQEACFGDRPLSPDDEDEIETFRTSLRSLA